MVEDIIDQLDDVGRSMPNLVSFLMPWDCVIKEFECEAEYRGRNWEEEKTNEGVLRHREFEKNGKKL